MNVRNFKSEKTAPLREKNIMETLTFVQENLALKSNFSEEMSTYEKPSAKKIKILKPTKKIFMGCWNQSYAENDGDGC